MHRARSLQFADDVITISDGGTWSERGTLRETTGGQVTDEVFSDNGTWVQSGHSIRFHSNVYGTMAAGTLGANQLTLVDDVPFTYSFAR